MKLQRYTLGIAKNSIGMAKKCYQNWKEMLLELQRNAIRILKITTEIEEKMLARNYTTSEITINIIV